MPASVNNPASKVQIVVDSTIAVPPDADLGDDVKVLSLFVNHDGREYRETSMDVDDFYARLPQMIDDVPTSSQPSPAAIEAVFEEAAAAGRDVLGIFISTGLSGTYDSALRAARAVRSRHIGFKFALVDSASCGGDSWGALAEALDAVRSGYGLSHCAQRALFGVQSSRFLFAPESLAFLKAGGRIGRASALLGGLMQICPVLTVTDGTVRVLSKVRTHKKALAKILDAMQADIDRAQGLKRLIVHYIGDRAPAVKWERDVIFPRFGVHAPVMPVSPVVGVHVGPAMGVAYQCNLPLPQKITGNIQSQLIDY